jgi:hypothetical protein
MKMGAMRCPETLVKDYHSTLRNISEERRFQMIIAAEFSNHDYHLFTALKKNSKMLARCKQLSHDG